MTSALSFTSFNIAARSRGSFSMATLPFIFQFPATSGRGPSLAIIRSQVLDIRFLADASRTCEGGIAYL